MNAPTLDLENDADRRLVLWKQAVVTARRMRRWQRLWQATRDRVAQKNAAHRRATGEPPASAVAPEQPTVNTVGSPESGSPRQKSLF